MIPKFKVYYEAEVYGKKLRGIEECCSWFLLTQTGEIMIYGPCDAPAFPNKNYTKIIPLFYTGLKDKNGKEIYEGDILDTKTNGLVVCVWGIEQDMFGCVGFCFNYKLDMPGAGGVVVNKSEHYEIIGNIHNNPELLEGK